MRGPVIVRRRGRAMQLFCALVVGWFVSFAYGDLSDLPIGHRKITEGEEGNINVEARCVPTKDLLETLAARTGKQIVFEKPCLTYVSMWMNDVYRPAEYWVRRVAFLGALMEVRSEESRLVVYPSGSSYDASLDEGQVLAAFRTPEVRNVQPSVGLVKGVYIYHGQFIPPPYKLEYIVRDDSVCDVLVNGVTVDSILPVTPPHDVSGVPDLPQGGQFSAPGSLCKYVAYRLYPGFLRQLTSEEALKEVIVFLRSQEIVQEIVSKDPPICVLFSDLNNVYSDVFPCNYDYRTGTVINRRMSEPVGPRVHEAETRVASLGRSLDRGAIEVNSAFGEVTNGGVPTLEQFLYAVSLYDTVSLLQMECLLTEIVGDRMIARELAVNLRAQSVELQTTVRTVLELLRTESLGPSTPDAPLQRIDTAADETTP